MRRGMKKNSFSAALIVLTSMAAPELAYAVQPTAPSGSVPVQQQTTVPGQGQIPAPGTPLPNLPKLPNVNQESFKQVTEEAAPLSPVQIKSLRRLVDDAERAASSPPRFVPKPVSSSVTVSLMPGETPPVARLFSNYVTNILFVDQVGNPLVVTDVDPGAASQFTVTFNQKAKEGSNLIKISPNSSYAMGNISVSLDGVQSPVSLTLVSGQREVDYRVDVRVKGVGGGGRGAVASAALPSGANPMMLGMLEGVAPDGAKTLTSSSSDVQAWEFRGRFYVRTSYTLLSPAYLAMQKSADGSAVYEITPTPVLIALSGGGTIQINLSGY